MKETLEKLLHSHKMVLVAFMNAGKANEAEVAKVMAKVKETYGDDLGYAEVDCAYHVELRKKYQIDNYPTYILFEGDRQVWRGNTHHAKAIEESIEAIVNH